MASDALNRRYDLIKKKLTNETQAAHGKQNEDLQRNLARMGQVNSGAGLKLQRQLGDEQMKQVAAVGEGVEAERAGAEMQEQEMERQRQFAREERLSSQEFARGEREGSQSFMRGEREGSQAFATSERLGTQGFSKSLFDAEMKFKEKGMKVQQGQFAQQMKLAMKQFKLDEKVSNFNMDMAEKMWNKKDMAEWFANMNGYDPRTGGGYGPLGGSSPFNPNNRPGNSGGGNSGFSPPMGGGNSGGPSLPGF